MIAAGQALEVEHLGKHDSSKSAGGDAKITLLWDRINMQFQVTPFITLFGATPKYTITSSDLGVSLSFQVSAGMNTYAAHLKTRRCVILVGVKP